MKKALLLIALFYGLSLGRSSFIKSSYVYNLNESLIEFFDIVDLSGNPISNAKVVIKLDDEKDTLTSDSLGKVYYYYPGNTFFTCKIISITKRGYRKYTWPSIAFLVQGSSFRIVFPRSSFIPPTVAVSLHNNSSSYKKRALRKSIVTLSLNFGGHLSEVTTSFNKKYPVYDNWEKNFLPLSPNGMPYDEMDMRTSVGNTGFDMSIVPTFYNIIGFGVGFSKKSQSWQEDRYVNWWDLVILQSFVDETKFTRSFYPILSLYCFDFSYRSGYYRLKVMDYAGDDCWGCKNGSHVINTYYAFEPPIWFDLYDVRFNYDITYFYNLKFLLTLGASYVTFKNNPIISGGDYGIFLGLTTKLTF